MILRASWNRNDESLEWSPELLGFVSVPLVVAGVILFSFPDFVYRWLQWTARETSNPNQGFEENLPYKELGRLLEWIIKSVGLLMIGFGVYLFWFAEPFYDFWLQPAPK